MARDNLSGDGDLNLNTSLDVDDDLLNSLGRSVQAKDISAFMSPEWKIRIAGEDVLNQALVDSHLESVPGLGTLTVGGLAGLDLQGLGGKTDRALDVQRLGAGTVNELLADLLEGLDLAGGEGDTDLVDLLYIDGISGQGYSMRII